MTERIGSEGPIRFLGGRMDETYACLQATPPPYPTWTAQARRYRCVPSFVQQGSGCWAPMAPWGLRGALGFRSARISLPLLVLSTAQSSRTRKAMRLETLAHRRPNRLLATR